MTSSTATGRGRCVVCGVMVLLQHVVVAGGGGGVKQQRNAMMVRANPNRTAPFEIPHLLLHHHQHNAVVLVRCMQSSVEKALPGAARCDLCKLQRDSEMPLSSALDSRFYAVAGTCFPVFVACCRLICLPSPSRLSRIVCALLRAVKCFSGGGVWEKKSGGKSLYGGCMDGSAV
jgi:hypothetical protein